VSVSIGPPPERRHPANPAIRQTPILKGAADPERGWRRLQAIAGIGRWTIQMLACAGQGRLDQLPAGDLAYLKLVGRLRGRDPRARATEDEVERFFAPYAPYGALAGVYALKAGASGAGRRMAA